MDEVINAAAQFVYVTDGSSAWAAAFIPADQFKIIRLKISGFNRFFSPLLF